MWSVTDTILFLCPGWWIRRRWGFSSVLGRGGRKLTGAHLRLSQTLTQDLCQGWFSGGKSPGNQWWNIQDECSETLIGIHKARFRWGNDLPMNCSLFWLRTKSDILGEMLREGPVAWHWINPDLTYLALVHECQQLTDPSGFLPRLMLLP